MKHQTYFLFSYLAACTFLCMPQLLFASAHEHALQNAPKEYALNKARMQMLLLMASPQWDKPQLKRGSLKNLLHILRKYPELHGDYFKATMSKDNYIADNPDEFSLIRQCILKYSDQIATQTDDERTRIARRVFELKLEDALLQRRIKELKKYVPSAAAPHEKKLAIITPTAKLLAAFLRKSAQSSLVEDTL